MRKLCICVMFVASVGHVFGQQSLTVTASRSISLQTDEVVFAVNVSSGLNTGLDDVVAALSGSGITAANFVSVNMLTSQQNTVLEWLFNLPVPFSKIKDTVTSLTALQKTIGQNKSGLNVSFNVGGTQVSPQLQASQQCPIPDLIADARAQAQKMANSAGLTVGPILALSDGGGVAAASGSFTFVSARLGDFSGPLGIPLISIPYFVPPTPPLNCTINVKFSVLTPQ